MQRASSSLRKGAALAPTISAPFFEIGPKTYLDRASLLELVEAASTASVRYDVAVILTPPALDIEAVKKAGPRLWVFAQSMDTAPPGRSTGSILPEALKAVGADGVMLNHAERPLQESALPAAIGRARDAGLLTMICAEDVEQAKRYASWGPDMLLVEPHDLIGTASRTDRPWIPEVNEAVGRVNPDVLIMHSGGIADEEAVRAVISRGAAGTGCTTAIVQATDRRAVTARMIHAARQGWDARATELVPSLSTKESDAV
jgi:triosephosphate isomerase (TIM)